MREENYFEKKLEGSKDTLRYTISELESVDIQIKKLTREYEYNLDLYNKRATRLQEIKVDMEKKIKSLQEKLDQGYTCIDMRTGKAYKSFDDRHANDLKQKTKEAEEHYKKMKKAYDLKKRKGEILKPVVEAPTGEVIKTQQERELQLLKEKLERLEKQKKELKIIEKEVKEPEIKPIETPEEVIIEERKSIAGEIRKIADEMNHENDEIEWLKITHPEWIADYMAEEGGMAIWQGRITNGFRTWLEAKGYKIGE